MSLKKNIVTTVSVRILRLFTGFACTMLLARYLKPEGMGVVATFTAIPLMLSSLAELGIRQSIAYSVGQEKYNINEISRATSFLWLITSCLSMVVVLIVYYFQGMYDHGVGICLIGALFVPITLILRYANGMGLGKQWIGRINVAEGFNAIGRLTLILLFVVLLRLYVTGALLMEVVVVLLPGAMMLYWLKSDLGLKFTPKWNPNLSKSLILHGFKYALALFVMSLNYRINILILQRFVSDSEIGYFSVGIRLAELIWLIPASVGMVIFSHSTASADPHEFSLKTIQVLKINLYLCSIGAIVFGVLCPFFIGFLFGKEYLPSVPIIRMMLPGIVAMVIFKILNADLAGKGKPLFALKAFIFALIINVILNLILVPYYGAFGSAVASTISYCFGAVLYIIQYSIVVGLDVKDIVWNPKADFGLLKILVKMSQKKI